MVDDGIDTVGVWTSEMQKIGMIDHDFVARFDPKFIEKVLEKPVDGLEDHQKGNTHGDQTC